MSEGANDTGACLEPHLLDIQHVHKTPREPRDRAVPRAERAHPRQVRLQPRLRMLQQRHERRDEHRQARRRRPGRRQAREATPVAAVQRAVAQHHPRGRREEVRERRGERDGARMLQHAAGRVQPMALAAAADADEAGVRGRRGVRGHGGVARERKRRGAQRLGEQEKVLGVGELGDGGRDGAVDEQPPLLDAATQRLKVLDSPARGPRGAPLFSSSSDAIWSAWRSSAATGRQCGAAVSIAEHVQTGESSRADGKSCMQWADCAPLPPLQWL